MGMICLDKKLRDVKVQFLHNLQIHVEESKRSFAVKLKFKKRVG